MQYQLNPEGTHKLPISVISHGLGHSNERTTEIYLKSLDMTIVDNANRKILQQLDSE